MNKIKLPNGKQAISFVAEDDSQLAIVHLSLIQRLAKLLPSAKVPDIIAFFAESLALSAKTMTLEMYVDVLKEEVAFHESVNLIKEYKPEELNENDVEYWAKLYNEKELTNQEFFDITEKLVKKHYNNPSFIIDVIDCSNMLAMDSINNYLSHLVGVNPVPAFTVLYHIYRTGYEATLFPHVIKAIEFMEAHAGDVGLKAQMAQEEAVADTETNNAQALDFSFEVERTPEDLLKQIDMQPKWYRDELAEYINKGHYADATTTTKLESMGYDMSAYWSWRNS